ncbi:MAG: NAD-dependent epimerase/dehydratase family protein [Deltaproteobacteria bacterium]|nr:NAD-dependent epimerase/dehydratase family protein [Deltaproteobacteria bacterium]
MEGLKCQIKPGTQVLLTGATGFTGSWLAHKLLGAGLAVRAIARESSDLRPFKSLSIEWIRGALYDPEVVTAATKGVEYIFNVAGAFRQAKIEDAEYFRVHVVATQLLARAAALNPSFKRFVHVSTMGVHGHIKNPPADENSPFAAGDQYQRTKLEGELWLHDFARRNSLGYTVIRPTGIYGPGDRRLLKVFKMATWPLCPILGYGKCLYHLVHVDDLTNVLMLSAVHPEAQGEVFLVGDAEAIPLAEMVKIISASIGGHTRIVRLPVLPFFAAGALCEWVCKPFGIEPPIYRRRVAFFTKDRSFNTSKMRDKLGYKPRYSTRSGLESTAAWYIENGWLKPPRKY